MNGVGIRGTFESGLRGLGRGSWELKINPKTIQGGTEIYLLFYFRKEHKKEEY
jgi:hypothetical protein